MSSSLILSGLTIHSEQGDLTGSVEIADGRIKSISQRNIASSITFPKDYHLIPGFIDLHVHGAKGRDVMDANVQALTTMSTALAEEGVTGFLATTMTASIERIEQALCCVRDFMRQQNAGAKILGVHLEGPFLSPEKVGAQSLEKLLPLKIDILQRWQSIAKDIIKIVTFAPELSGSDAFIHYLKQQNIVASLGHTNADFLQSMHAIEMGCSHVTHVFNAMRGMHQREPGAVGAALLSDQVTAEIIVDGVHVHPAMIDLAFKLKGKEKLILVTDAMRAKCLCEGQYELGGQQVEVKNNIAKLKNGTLAGSTLKIPTALKNMMQFTHCHLMDAVKMASENPAKVIGVFNQKGSIAVGKDADLVVLDRDLNVVLTVVGGEVVFERSRESVIFP